MKTSGNRTHKGLIHIQIGDFRRWNPVLDIRENDSARFDPEHRRLLAERNYTRAGCFHNLQLEVTQSLTSVL